MNGPPSGDPADDRDDDSRSDDDRRTPTTGSVPSSSANRTGGTDRRVDDPSESPPVGDRTDVDVPVRDSGGDYDAERARPRDRRGVGGLVPEASVDSRWWYWIAAVPVYFALMFVAGIVAFVLGVFAMMLDVLGLGGLASVGTFVLFALGAVLFMIPGLVLSVLFPLALYVDARAVSEADVGWNPDPALYALVGLAGVVVTAFTVSVPLALYYLYKRHKVVGVP